MERVEEEVVAAKRAKNHDGSWNENQEDATGSGGDSNSEGMEVKDGEGEIVDNEQDEGKRSTRAASTPPRGDVSTKVTKVKVHTAQRELKEIFDILIPNDVTELIFKRLKPRDIRRARQVNKRWAELIDSTMTWSPYLFDHGIPEIVKFIEKGYPVDQLKVSKLEDFNYPEGGMGFAYVRAIHFLPFLDKADGNKCKGISTNNLSKLMTELKNIEEMHLHSMALNRITRPSKVFTTFDFPLLKVLQISTLDKDGPGFNVCLDAFLNTYPSLEKVSASIFFDKEDELVQHPPNYKEVFEFLVRHKKTLRSMHLDYSASNQPHPISFAFDHDMSTAEFETLKTGLKSVQLEEFAMSPSFYEGQARFVFASSLLESQKRLAVLDITHLSQWNRSMWTTIQMAISNCSDTLKTIVCRGCFCPADGEAHIAFSCNALKACRGLKNLQISVCGLKVEDISGIPETIEILDLGVHLTKEHIDYLSSGRYPEIKKWILRPSKKEEGTPVPTTTILTFKRILQNCPKLRDLIIFKKNSEWKKIKKFIQKTEGLDDFKCPDEMEIGSGYSLIFINRKRLQYNF